MAHIDRRKRIIQAKLVYYGPGLCGKTANLEYINRSLCKGEELMSLATEGDRTIFFDFMPLESDSIAGMKVSFRLYTVPGQVRYSATRKMVLKNVDGVVFVADSQPMMLDANVESFEDLFGNLKELGIPAANVDLVLQYNKRDLPMVLAKAELDQALNEGNYPVFLSSALTGEGVLETLRHAARMVLRRIARDLKEDPDSVDMPVPAGASGGVGQPAALPSGKGDVPQKAEPPRTPPTAARATVSAVPTRTLQKDAAATAAPPSPVGEASVPSAADELEVEAIEVAEGPASSPQEAPGKGEAPQSAESPPAPLVAARAASPTSPARATLKSAAPPPATMAPSLVGATNVPTPAGPPGVVGGPAALPWEQPAKGDAPQSIETPPNSPNTARATVAGVGARATLKNAAPPAATKGDAPQTVEASPAPLSSARAVLAAMAARAALKKAAPPAATLPPGTAVGTAPSPAGSSGKVGGSVASPGEASGKGEASQSVEAQLDSPATPTWGPNQAAPSGATLKNGALAPEVPVAPKVTAAATAVPDAAGTAAPQTADGSALGAIPAVPVGSLGGEPAANGASPAGPVPGADALAMVERRLDAISAMVGNAATVHEHLRSEVELVRDSTAQLAKSSAAGKEELAGLRRDLVGLARKEDVADLYKELVALAEKTQGQKGGLAGLSRELEALPSKEDVEQLREDLATMVEKARSDRGGFDPALLRKELEVLPRREDLAVLRMELAAVTEKAQSTGGASDPVALRRELAGLPTRQELAALTKLVEGLGAEVAALRGHFDQALAEIRRAPLGAATTGGPPGTSEPKAAEARQEEAKAGPALTAKEQPQTKPEETAQEESQAKPEEPAAEEAQAKPEEPAPEEAPAKPDERAPEEAQAKPEETPPEEAQAKPEETPPPEAQSEPKESKPEEPRGFERQPEHVNAARVARVMVADLNLYHRTEVEEGIKAGDLHARIKETLDDMKVTYASRIPEEIRSQKDYLTDELEKMIAKKRKSLGLA